MTLFIVFLPLVNYLIFVLCARFVNWFTLATYTSVSVGLLVALLSVYPTIVQESIYTSTLGTWIASELFEINGNFSKLMSYTLFIVFSPLVNYLIFVLCARFVNRFTLAIALAVLLRVSRYFVLGANSIARKYKQSLPSFALPAWLLPPGITSLFTPDRPRLNAHTNVSLEGVMYVKQCLAKASKGSLHWYYNNVQIAETCQSIPCNIDTLVLKFVATHYKEIKETNFADLDEIVAFVQTRGALEDIVTPLVFFIADVVGKLSPMLFTI